MIELLKIPLREMRAKFTKSEITMFGWRSAEQYWQFKEKTAGNKPPRDDYEEDEPDEPEEFFDPVEGEQGFESNVDGKIDVDAIYAALDKRYSQKKSAKPQKQSPGRIRPRSKRRSYGDAIPAGLPSKFFNDAGEIDLRKVTGAEAHKYFNAIGCPLPIIQRFDK